MQTILLHLLAASLYAGLGVHFWRASIQASATRPRSSMSSTERIILLGALLAHGAALQSALFPGTGMRFGFAFAVSLMTWLAICFYWVETFYARLDGLHGFVLLAGVAGSVLTLIFPGEHELTNAASGAFRAHFIIAMLAYSLFTLAALHAMLMAIAERQLHSGRLTRPFANLPPLLTMETLLFRLIGIAFILLTLTLTTGVVFSENLFGQAFRFDHKTIFALVSWLLFGALLIGRRIYGWRGRVALRWTLAGFVALVLAYVGSRFVIEVLLSRAN